MLFAAATTTSSIRASATILRSAFLQSTITKRHMSLAASVASLKGVDFMAIDQLR
jgi:hypothetical protein